MHQGEMMTHMVQREAGLAITCLSLTEDGCKVDKTLKMYKRIAKCGLTEEGLQASHQVNPVIKHDLALTVAVTLDKAVEGRIADLEPDGIQGHTQLIAVEVTTAIGIVLLENSLKKKIITSFNQINQSILRSTGGDQSRFS